MAITGTPIGSPSSSDVLCGGAPGDNVPADALAALELAAVGPASVTVAGQTVAARPIGEIIEADRYLRSRTAAAGRKLPLGIARIVPPGCG